MGTPKSLHEQAMILYSEALAAEAGGDLVLYVKLCEQALEFEQQAAMMLRDRYDAEPTRSVLFRSAASLALRCGRHALAEQLAAFGLAGSPSPLIRKELREVLDRVGFADHLEQNGLKLSQRAFGLSLYGKGAYPGFAKTALVAARVSCLQDIYTQVYERKRGRPYRSRSKISEADLQKSALYGSVEEDGNYGFVLRWDESDEANTIGGIGFASRCVDEMLLCFEMLGKKEAQVLREYIGNEKYYAHFVQKAREIAPDGREVKLVGFSALRNGRVWSMTLRRLKSEI